MFYPIVWQGIVPVARNAPYLGIFKAKFNEIIRPTPKQVFDVHDSKGIATLTQNWTGAKYPGLLPVTTFTRGPQFTGCHPSKQWHVHGKLIRGYENAMSFVICDFLGNNL